MKRQLHAAELGCSIVCIPSNVLFAFIVVLMFHEYVCITRHYYYSKSITGNLRVFCSWCKRKKNPLEQWGKQSEVIINFIRVDSIRVVNNQTSIRESVVIPKAYA